MNTRHDSIWSAYGSVTAEGNAVATTIPGTSSDFTQKAQFEEFAADGPALDCIPRFLSNWIEITKAGAYRIAVSISLHAALADVVSLAVFKNAGTTQVGVRCEQTLLASAGLVAVKFEVEGDFIRGDTVELWMQNQSNTADITGKHVNMSATLLNFRRGR